MERERRALAAELRAKGRRLEGYAAVFDYEAALPGFTEVLRPGAFAATLAERSDVLALVDHDAGKLLARTKSGSLRLAEDTRGLSFSLDVPDTTAGRDVLALAERGDLGRPGLARDRDKPGRATARRSSVASADVARAARDRRG